MCAAGEPVVTSIEKDRYHLSNKGVSKLAANIKKTMYKALDLPPVDNRQTHMGGSTVNNDRHRVLITANCINKTVTLQTWTIIKTVTTGQAISRAWILLAPVGT